MVCLRCCTLRYRMACRLLRIHWSMLVNVMTQQPRMCLDNGSHRGTNLSMSVAFHVCLCLWVLS